jgi:hypothetical protein
MSKNQYPEESANSQPTDVMSRSERMADLPPKPVPQPVPPPPVVESTAEVENVETRQEEARTIRYAIGKLNDFLSWFVTVLEITLAIRFLLKLIGAEPSNLFTGFLYALTDIILFPFSNIVSPGHISPNLQNQAFEWSTLIAMGIYALIFWAIRRFLRILISSPTEEPIQ